MDVTPQLLKDVEFREKFRGYDPDEVDDFLERVGVAFAELNDKLRDAGEQVESANARAARAEARAQDSSEMDDTLRRTLVLAQRTADAAIKEAQEQAAGIVADAQARAAAEVTGSQERASQTLAAAEGESRRKVEAAEARSTAIVGEAETQANDTVAEAREQANRLLMDARQQSEQLIEAARTSADERAAAHREQLQAEVASLEERCDQLRQDARGLDGYVSGHRQRLEAVVADLRALLDDPARLAPPAATPDTTDLAPAGRPSDEAASAVDAGALAESVGDTYYGDDPGAGITAGADTVVDGDELIPGIGAETAADGEGTPRPGFGHGPDDAAPATATSSEGSFEPGSDVRFAGSPATTALGETLPMEGERTPGTVAALGAPPAAVEAEAEPDLDVPSFLSGARRAEPDDQEPTQQIDLVSLGEVDEKVQVDEQAPPADDSDDGDDRKDGGDERPGGDPALVGPSVWPAGGPPPPPPPPATLARTAQDARTAPPAPPPPPATTGRGTGMPPWISRPPVGQPPPPPAPPRSDSFFEDLRRAVNGDDGPEDERDDAATQFFEDRDPTDPAPRFLDEPGEPSSPSKSWFGRRRS